MSAPVRTLRLAAINAIQALASGSGFRLTESEINAAVSALPTFVGNTTVRTRRDGPAAHLYPGGIGNWIIGTDFQVQ